MCGIAGFCLNQKHNQNQTDLAAQMLLDIEHRGQDATGVAWINPSTGKRVIAKAAVAATQFINTDAGKRACAGATTAILHTRWATQGDPKVNDIDRFRMGRCSRPPNRDSTKSPASVSVMQGPLGRLSG